LERPVPAILRRTFGFALLGLMMAGCMAARPVSLQEARSYRLAALDVDVRSATINWADGQLAFLVSRGLDTNDPASADVLKTPEVKAAYEKIVRERLEARLRPALGAQMSGSRPVKVQFTFKSIFVPSTGARLLTDVLIGNVPPVMVADVVIVDAATGRTLLQLADNGSSLNTGGGVIGAAVTAAVESAATEAAFDRLATQQATNFIRWLLAE
jgi:hypothetical protein